VGAAGCATSHAPGGPDGAPGSADAAPRADARPGADARPPGGDAHPGGDGGLDGAVPDAVVDAAACLISTGDAIDLTGTGDLSKYPSDQLLAPGATLSGTDAVAITWDASYLFVTVTSDAFLSDYEPFHLYLETGAAPLGAATPSAGKEYGGLTAALPFTPTHLIAVRRVSDAGTGPYDGVYTPGGAPAWATRATPLAEGTDVLVSSDNRTISVRVPWTALGGCPTGLRLTAHVVHGVAGNEWKDLVPATTTPWLTDGGGYYEIDLTQAPPSSNWIVG
jgi:hypothetical protein